MAAEKRPCPKCGASNFVTDRECMSCGTSLMAQARPAPPAAAPAIPPPPPSWQQMSPAKSPLDAIIPVKNGAALTAYYVGLFCFIPVIGLPMAVFAFISGLNGYKFAKANPEVHGKAHAWVGIICGGFWGLVHLAIVIIFIVGWIQNGTS